MEGIGKRIRNRRIELGMTQKELADKLGYKNKSTIGKIENGQNDITQTKVLDFARALETDVSYIMGFDTKDKEKKFILNIAKDDAEFLKKFHQLSDSHKKIVMALIDSLLNSWQPLNRIWTVE